MCYFSSSSIIRASLCEGDLETVRDPVEWRKLSRNIRYPCR
jgi:hypothetical protein